MFDESMILLVEDFHNDMTLLRWALRQAHIDNPVWEVWDGEGAIGYLKGEGKYANRHFFPLPGLVLLDLDLPKVSGLEVLRWIHEQPQFRALRIVALIGPENLSAFGEAWGLGVAHFLTKPLDLKEAIRLLGTLSHEWLPDNSSASRPFLQPLAA
jgi:CheY-like chemotaxis protein